MKGQRKSHQGLMRQLAILILVVAVQCALAQDGNVTVSWNTPFMENVAWNCVNRLEITISNSSELTLMSLGFELSYDVPLVFDPGFSSRPGEWDYVSEMGRASGAFTDPGSIIIDTRIDGISPDTILISASANPGDGLPPGCCEPCYELHFEIPWETEICFSCIQVDNVFVPPSGSWTFDDGAIYAPTYCEQPNTSQQVPDAPPVVGDYRMLPAMPPSWVTVPPATAYQNHCQPYCFVCVADEGGNEPAANPVTYYTSVGYITNYGGELMVPAPGVCDTQEVMIRAVNAVCNTRTYDFDIVWTNEDPQVSNCPTTIGEVGVGATYSYPFGSFDADACDDATFAANAFGTSPAGDYSMSQEGEFSFTPNAADEGQTFEFRVTATDNCGGEDQCQFFVEVAAPLCGDCDGNGIVNVSDAVYLINYIFGGGLPPNPPSVADVDCDQIVNISDAVYEIGYIFGGGPAPCEACPQGL